MLYFLSYSKLNFSYFRKGFSDLLVARNLYYIHFTSVNDVIEGTTVNGQTLVIVVNLERSVHNPLKYPSFRLDRE